MKKRYVLAAAALLLLPAAPASAATTRRLSFACAPGSVAKAKVTYRLARGRLTRVAGKNPCDRWLSIGWNVAGRSPSSGSSVEVAPGARFDWRHRSFRADRVYAGLLGPEQTCHDGDGAHYVVGAEDACE